MDLRIQELIDSARPLDAIAARVEHVTRIFCGIL